MIFNFVLIYWVVWYLLYLLKKKLCSICALNLFFMYWANTVLHDKEDWNMTRVDPMDRLLWRRMLKTKHIGVQPPWRGRVREKEWWWWQIMKYIYFLNYFCKIHAEVCFCINWQCNSLIWACICKYLPLFRLNFAI